MTLADRLKKIRKDLNKSQKEIAEMIDVSYPAWQGYELGKNAPGSSVIEELVKLGYNANWILTGKGEMKKEASKDASSKIFTLCLSIVTEYQDGLQEKMSPEKQGKLLRTLWEILCEQSEEWQTVERGNTILKALLKISDDFKIFRKLNMDSESTRAFLAFLNSPDSMPGDPGETDQKGKKKI
jgi:transcriptional regulator with XRE-family HTH domain